MKQMTINTGHAFAAFDDAVIFRAVLNSIIECNNGDISETQRNASNARREEYKRVQTMLALIASNIDGFKSSCLNPSPSPDTDTVLFRFLEAGWPLRNTTPFS